MLGEGALFVLGADLTRVPEVLLPAYDDAQGVTAAFNCNLLARINRELGADFDLDAFEHRAVWNERESRVEMHLVSRRDQTARLGSCVITFVEGEAIHTEDSHKYQIESLARIVERTGWRVETSWITDTPSSSVLLLAGDATERSRRAVNHRAGLYPVERRP